MLLFNRKGEDICVTEAIIIAAMGNKRWGNDILEHLLQHRGHEIHITEAVLMTAAGNCSCGHKDF